MILKDWFVKEFLEKPLYPGVVAARSVFTGFGKELVEPVLRYLQSKTGVQITCLENLHLDLNENWKRTKEGASLPALSTQLSWHETPEVYESYQRLLKRITVDLLQSDVFFEREPFLRIYFPQKLPDRFRLPNGKVACYHVDSMLRESFDEINFWLGLSSSYDSNALQLGENLADSLALLAGFVKTYSLDKEQFFDSRELFFEYLKMNPSVYEQIKSFCRPFNLSQGDLCLFDSRILHGTAENCEQTTRVSIDFRLIPALRSDKRERIEIGGFYAEKTNFYSNS